MLKIVWIKQQINSFYFETMHRFLPYNTITPHKERVTSFLTFLEILWLLFYIYQMYHHITCDTTGKVAREVGEIGPWRSFSYFVSLMLESRLKVRKMAVRANTFRVNVICFLILIMTRFSCTKRLNEVKTDGLSLWIMFI